MQKGPLTFGIACPVKFYFALDLEEEKLLCPKYSDVKTLDYWGEKQARGLMPTHLHMISYSFSHYFS